MRSLRIFFHLVYRRLMQFVQRVHNLHVSVDQQTRPYWEYSSAYCLWTWTGEVQKLLSTLSKTDTFQSSTRCWPERGVISLFIYRISSNNGRPSNNHPPPFWWKYLNSSPPPHPSRHLLFLLSCQVDVESNPAKLSSDDSSSQNQSRNQIWNT